MHQCAECGARVATAGALALHETTGHGPTAKLAVASLAPLDTGRAMRTGRSRTGKVMAGTITIAVLGLALVVLGVGGRAAYHEIVKATDSKPAGQPAAPTAAPAPSQSTAAAAPSGVLAVARQKYLAVAAAYNVDMARSKDEPTLSLKIWGDYAAALRNYDRGLRSIAVPASIQPAVATLLADDAQMEGYFDKLAVNGDCGCGTAPFTLKTKIRGDVDRLRVAIGLPPGGNSNTDPGS